MPKKFPRDRKREWATFPIDKQLLDRLDELAVKEDRSRSAVIRQLLLRALNSEKEKIA